MNHPLYKRNYSSIDVDLLLSDFNNVDWNINVLNKNVTLNEAESCRDVYHNTFITELNKLMDWFKLNRLLLNYKKSQYFFFGPNYPIQYEPEFLLQFYTKSAPIIYYFLKNILI